MEKVREILTFFPPWMFSIITLICILWLTLAPQPLGENAPELFPGADKIVHGIMFGGFTLMMALDYQRRHEWRRIRFGTMVLLIIISSGTGIAIEYLQLLMDSGRGFEITDMIGDGTGAILAGLGWMSGQKEWSR